jgi:hypothetical protein
LREHIDIAGPRADDRRALLQVVPSARSSRRSANHPNNLGAAPPRVDFEIRGETHVGHPTSRRSKR